jgi:hypothetical protein
MHFDDGVPWEEALAGAPYPQGFADALDFKARSIPDGHQVYLAVTPIAFLRDRLADRRGSGGGEPLRPPWQGRSFDHPEVVAAYAAHCERMVAAFSPDFVAYGIEVNMLAELAPAQWPAFLRLAAEVHPRLKARRPTLPVFVTLQADFFHARPAAQAEAIRQVLPFTDVVAVSTYPYTQDPSPQALRPDHFSALRDLAPGKPFAVAETAWPAEDVSAPATTRVPASEESQRLYVERLLADADRLSAMFVTWFFTRDYDDLWESHLRLLPDAPLIRLWKDTGLYDGSGRPRAGLEAWRRALARRRGAR